MLVDPRSGVGIPLPPAAADALARGVGAFVFVPVVPPLPSRANLENDPPRYCLGGHERAADCDWIDLVAPAGDAPLRLHLGGDRTVEVRVVRVWLQRLRAVTEGDACAAGAVARETDGDPVWWTGDAPAGERLQRPSALAALAAWWDDTYARSPGSSDPYAQSPWSPDRCVWRLAVQPGAAVRADADRAARDACDAICEHPRLSTMPRIPAAYVDDALARWPAIDLRRELLAAGDFLVARHPDGCRDLIAFLASWCARAQAAAARPAQAPPDDGRLPARDLLPWLAHVVLDGGAVTEAEVARAAGLDPAGMRALADEGRAVAERVRARLEAMRTERARHGAGRDE